MKRSDLRKVNYHENENIYVGYFHRYIHDKDQNILFAIVEDFKGKLKKIHHMDIQFITYTQKNPPNYGFRGGVVKPSNF